MCLAPSNTPGSFPRLFVIFGDPRTASGQLPKICIFDRPPSTLRMPPSRTKRPPRYGARVLLWPPFRCRCAARRAPWLRRVVHAAEPAVFTACVLRARCRRREAHRAAHSYYTARGVTWGPRGPRAVQVVSSTFIVSTHPALTPLRALPHSMPRHAGGIYISRLPSSMSQCLSCPSANCRLSLCCPPSA